MRRETDALGELEVPDDVYYGIQTVRCVGNYRVGPHSYNEYPEIIRAMAEIKMACAETNRMIGALKAEKAEAIAAAAREIVSGRHADQFPVNVWRSQGTGVNMNVNEVIANRANELLTGHRGYDAVHPNTHVNMCQSSNDVFPTAEAIVFYRLTEALCQAAERLEASLGRKAQRYRDAVRLGRTGFQDAVPMTWGQVMGGWQSSVHRVRRSLADFRSVFQSVVLGGTAVGTGLGQLPGYADHVYENLSKIVGFEMHLARMASETVPDSAVFDAMRNTDHHVELMNRVKAVMSAAARIAHDVEAFASGPRAGIGELRIPVTGPGVSGIPGEATPYACELVLETLGEVLSAEKLAELSAAEGELDHSSQNSAAVIRIIDALKTSTQAVVLFTDQCIDGLEVNEAVCRRNAELSTSLSTVASTLFGYPVGTAIAKQAIRDGITCKEAALRDGLLPAEVCEELFNVRMLTDRRHLMSVMAKYLKYRSVA